VEGITDEMVGNVVRAALDRPDAVVDRWEAAAPAGFVVDNMTTARLDRVRGTLTDGTPWSLFAKTLRPASASPQWATIPPFAQGMLLERLDWLDEPRIYRSCVTTDLPTGVRLPHLWHVEEGDDRIVLWMEDVTDRAVWDLDTYRRAAEGLGRLAGRWPEARVERELGLRRRPLSWYAEGKVLFHVIPWLADEATWADPLVAAATADDPGLRTDLARLAADGVLDLTAPLDALPHALGHGDATPANILDDGTDLVLIDWSYGASLAVGLDLGQLVAGAIDGRAVVDLALVAAVDAMAVDAYVAGMEAEGVAVDRAAVERAYLIGLVVRSAFTAIDVGHAADLPEEHRAALLAQRTGLARLALDRLAATGP
jgi:hypothetical protein